MPAPFSSRSEFESAFDEMIRGEFEHIRRSYKNQQIRKVVLLLIALTSAMLAMRILFAPLMLVYFAIGFGLYFLIMRNRTSRIKVDEEMRRMLHRRIAKMSSHPSAIHTHQYLSESNFHESELFNIKPDKYVGNELIEIGKDQELELSHILVEGESIPQKEKSKFEGWFLKLNRRPDDPRTDWEIAKLKLPGEWTDNLKPNTYFAAGSLAQMYKTGFTSIKLNRDAIWDFYRLINWALRAA